MKKKIWAVVFLFIIIVCFIRFVKIESVDQHYEDATQTFDSSKTVTITIRCDTVLKNYDKLDEALRNEEYVPSDGVILEETSFFINDNDTVFDVLQRAVSDKQIQMEYQGSRDNIFGSVYILGINFLYEFSCGPLSGWMYKVNGVSPDVGCDQYRLSDGDVVEWLYTCDLGNDIGCDTDIETEVEP